MAGSFGHLLTNSVAHPAASTEFYFGSLLPDYIGMNQNRLAPNLDPEIEAGVRFHQQTDAAINQSPTFQFLKKQLRQLIGDHLPDGAARMVSDAGTELLLDGYFVQNASVVRAYYKVMKLSRSSRFDPAQTALDSQRFAQFWTGQPPQDIYDLYKQPSFVAERLHKRLQPRPKLCFEVSALSLVSKKLGEVQPVVGDNADQVFNEMLQNLAITNEVTQPFGPANRYITIIPEKLPPKFRGTRTAAETKQALSTLGRLAQMSASAVRQGYYLNRDGLSDDDIYEETPDRPLLPSSITHKNDWAMAAAADEVRYAAIGLDLEDNEHQNPKLLDFKYGINSKQEIRDFEDNEAILLFSLKEAAGKAISNYLKDRSLFITRGLVEIERVGDRQFKPKIINKEVGRRLSGDAIDLSVTRSAKWIVSLAAIDRQMAFDV